MGIHDHHRQRLKERYLEYGIENLEPHVFLELVLGYSIPRKDTNPLAHTLIDTFGSLEGVLNAPVSELTKINGITEHSAILLRLFGGTPKYLNSVKSKRSAVFRTLEDAASFIVPLFENEKDECVRIFCLEKNGRLIAHKKIFVGDMNTVRFKIVDITRASLAADASKIILAHNHPGGNPLPSFEDIDATRRISESLATNSIHLEEHFVVAGSKYSAIVKNFNK